MRINIAICDDEQESLHMIQKELYNAANKLKIEIETYAYNDGKKVLDSIYNENEDFDILFLDIDMPDISGLEIARKLRQKNLDIILIFISAHEQYVFESIEYNPFRYIRKTE
ncbi:MAG: LytR/AlgR family response regulator transcription factor [Anaerostipes sp.]